MKRLLEESQPLVKASKSPALSRSLGASSTDAKQKGEVMFDSS